MTALDRLAEIDKLATLPEPEYEDVRSKTAKRWGWRVTILDKEVLKRRPRKVSKPFEHSNTPRPSPTETGTSEGSNQDSSGVDPNTLYEVAKEIIEHPDPMALVEQAIIVSGYAGDPTPCELTYIAVTSRLLARPLNVQFLAQSASGKNYTVDTALQLFPPEAYYKLTASSPRALVYTDETFCHRTVILEESDSIPAEGPAASAIRSMIHGGRMIYEVVEKDPETGEWHTRKIEKEGPTGMVTTGVRALDAQMVTRLLTAPIPDSPAQTRAVLKAQAKVAQGQATTLSEAELEKFHAYQNWLAANASDTIIPFALILADMVPSKAVRARRDFPQFLTVIHTLALMAQRSRSRTEEGAINATLEDYRRARLIMAPLFDSVAADGITPAIRETVEAIKEDEEISNTELARRLNLATSTISYRVNGALRGGWLKNSETRKSYPNRLSRCDPLPEQRSALPTPEELKAKVDELEPHLNGDSNTDQPPVRERVERKAFERSNDVQPTECADDDGIVLYPDREGEHGEYKP